MTRNEEKTLELEERAVREFRDYASEKMIRAAFISVFRDPEYKEAKITSLLSVREVLISWGVEGIPFKFYRKQNDPKEVR